MNTFTATCCASITALVAGVASGVDTPAVAAALTAPSARVGMGIAYDAARGEIVLFGGGASCCDGNYLNDTWTWDGTTWTKKSPSSSPPPRTNIVLAYDAQRADVVLFGGRGNSAELNDTWTWDGTTWTEQHPATTPPVRDNPGMAYDALRSEVILFGGYQGCYHCNLDDTWTWDGTNWTERHPAVSPSRRDSMGIAYDALRGEVVLFGGVFYPNTYGDTWTWDGATWTRESPVASPPSRCCDGMAYDSLRGNVLMFGGSTIPYYLNGTWMWDGNTWTQQSPDHNPSRRGGSGMAYDPANEEVVLFGGGDSSGNALRDTWTWDGTDWGIPYPASLMRNPNSGPPGTVVTIRGSGFGADENVALIFIDSIMGNTTLGVVTTDGNGQFTSQVTVPPDSMIGTQHLEAHGVGSGQSRTRPFNVT